MTKSPLEQKQSTDTTLTNARDKCRIPVIGDYILGDDEIVSRQFEYADVSLRLVAEQFASMLGMTLNE